MGLEMLLKAKRDLNRAMNFWLKKKNPLQMPPDMNKLPMPGDSFETNNQTNNDDVKDLLKIKENNDTEDASSGSDLINNMKKKIQ